VNEVAQAKPEQKLIQLSEFKTSDETHGGFSGYANNFGILDS